MNEPSRRLQDGLFGILLAVTLLCGPLPAAAAWEVAHANPANTGFIDVVTAPAGKGSVSVPGLGTFAPGAGPVIAPDGTVYIGTLEGKLVALRADGSPFWSREITQGQAIVASPAIGADGSVYVVGVKVTTVRDNRGGRRIVKKVVESTLHTFTASGGWVAQTPFPRYRGSGAFTTAPPKMLRSGSLEVVLVPAMYVASPALEVRLIAFSTTSGAVVAEQSVTHSLGSAAGGSGIDLKDAIDCLTTLFYTCWPITFEPRPAPPDPATTLPRDLVAPMPAVAIFTYPGGGAPWVIVSDGRYNVAGYTYSGGAFRENFRVTDRVRRLTSPPVALPDAHTAVGRTRLASGLLAFVGPNQNPQASVSKDLGPVYAPPTRLADGRLVVVQKDGKIAVVRGSSLLSNASFGGESIAAAAASRTHVFVALVDAFYTFNADSLAVASKVDWVGGGTSHPAIGPQGHVYAIASNILFVFPPPKKAGAHAVSDKGAGSVTRVVGRAAAPEIPATAPPPGSDSRP